MVSGVRSGRSVTFRSDENRDAVVGIHPSGLFPGNFLGRPDPGYIGGGANPGDAQGSHEANKYSWRQGAF